LAVDQAAGAPKMNPTTTSGPQRACCEPSPRRAHLGLAVRDLEASLDFYRKLLDADPTRVEPRYARFVLDDPPLFLALNQVADTSSIHDAVSHFGVEVGSPSAVEAAIQRLAAAGLDVEIERGVDCCHAIQDKVWVRDPDGRRFEFFAVLEESAQHAPDPCCAPGTCQESAATRSCCP
jgi:catechol 2,3-dioxygenase-like lactoylglutathione lyase family enzyme